MKKKVEIVIDTDLVDEVIRRYGLADAREAVHLALRTLLSEGGDGEHEPPGDEYDEFSDLGAWERRRAENRG